MPDRDPVERALGDERDLQDVATWEPRTVSDRLAAAVADAVARRARSLTVLAALVIVLSQFAVTGWAVVRSPTMAALTVLSVLPAALLVGLVWTLDPTRRQSLPSLVVTFLLGGALAGFAAVVNSSFGFAFAAVPAVGAALFFVVVVGPVEEVVKLAAVRLYAYDRAEFDAVVDGAVYGAVAGLGFASVENAIYITVVSLQAAEAGLPAGPTLGAIAGVRALAGPGHVIYSAYAGYYLGLARFADGHRRAILARGLLGAVVIHAGYNVLVTYLPALVEFTLPLFVLVVVVYDGIALSLVLRHIVRYRANYRAATRDEDGEPASAG